MPYFISYLDYYSARRDNHHVERATVQEAKLAVCNALHGHGMMYSYAPGTEPEWNPEISALLDGTFLDNMMEGKSKLIYIRQDGEWYFVTNRIPAGYDDACVVVMKRDVKPRIPRIKELISK